MDLLPGTRRRFRLWQLARVAGQAAPARRAGRPDHEARRQSPAEAGRSARLAVPRGRPGGRRADWRRVRMQLAATSPPPTSWGGPPHGSLSADGSLLAGSPASAGLAPLTLPSLPARANPAEAGSYSLAPDAPPADECSRRSTEP